MRADEQGTRGWLCSVVLVACELGSEGQEASTTSTLQQSLLFHLIKQQFQLQHPYSLSNRPNEGQHMLPGNGLRLRSRHCLLLQAGAALLRCRSERSQGIEAPNRSSITGPSGLFLLRPPQPRPSASELHPALPPPCTPP